jgi:hypothetical protein
MRRSYDLEGGRPNPYAARLTAAARNKLVAWWAAASGNVRVLPDDVAREFPDTASTVQALRLVMKLRSIKPKATAKRRRRTGLS